MAIVRMKKLTLIGLEEEKNAILKAIQKLGSVEIQDISELGQDELPSLETEPKSLQAKDDNIDEKLYKVKSAIDLLENYSQVKKGMFTPKPQVSLEEFNNVLKRQADLLSSADDCLRLQDMLNEFSSKRARIRASIDQLSPWQNLTMPFEAIGQTNTSRAFLGTIQSSSINELQDWLEEEEVLADLEIVSEYRDHTYCLIAYHVSSEEEILDRLRGLEFERISLSGLKGTARQLLDKYNKDLEALEKEEGQVVVAIKELVKVLDDLKILYDGLLIDQQKYEASQRILNTGRAFVLKGWISIKDHEKLKKALYEITDAVLIQFEDPDEDDKVPTLLDNPPLVEPFEVVTNLYSTPSQRDVDPNKVMAPFYFALFGIMMGDAGYGILMAIVGTIMIRKLKLKGTAKKLVGVIALCGVSTFIWGVLSGGWFGDLGERIATAIGLETAVIWFSPMEEPLLMLGFCFAIGLLHVLVGMGVKAYMDIRDGYIWDAVFDQGLWFLLIAGLLLLLLPTTAAVGKYIAIGAAIGLVLTQGRAKKGIFSKFFSGLLSLYNITGIFSDVLSYSRLFALGLSSAIIGMVFNILASMLTGAWYSIVFAVAIFVVGHVFNILINLLGAFVHTSRLQYIEFFGKFFEGGGHTFTPLTIKTKYIDLTN